MTDILCDSSSLISLTNSCLGNLFSYLHRSFDLNFLISHSVFDEMITHPLNMKSKQYMLSAMRLKKLVNDTTISIVDLDVSIETNRLLDLANHIFFVSGKPLTLVHKGEIDIISLSHYFKIGNILIDERTTRMLMESPLDFKKHLEKEFKVNVMLNKPNLLKFKEYTHNIKVVRSTELLFVAYEKGFMDNLKSLKYDMLVAGLYNLKYSGCSIKYTEIEKLLKKS